MSTDFSIKPVGAPVAAPIVQPVSEAAQSAVATELPASQSVAAADASARVSIDSARRRAHPCRNQVVIDRDAASIVYQVVDNRTSQVVKQFPEEAVLRRRAYFHTLDLTKRRADAPARHRPQGLRKAPSLSWQCVGVGRVEIGLPGRGIGDDVLDLRLSGAGQHELGVADPERPVLDQHVLVFVGAVALVLHLGAKAGDVRDRRS